MIMQTCEVCSLEQPLSEYARVRPFYRVLDATWEQRRHECRGCVKRADQRATYLKDPGKVRDQSDRWRAANPERRKQISRNYTRKRRWAKLGLTPDEVKEIMLRSGGRCESCGDALTDEVGIAVDHCHTTGRVRGMLCAPCNKAEGFLKSDPRRAEAMARYLHKYTFLTVDLGS